MEAENVDGAIFVDFPGRSVSVDCTLVVFIYGDRFDFIFLLGSSFGLRLETACVLYRGFRDDFLFGIHLITAFCIASAFGLRPEISEVSTELTDTCFFDNLLVVIGVGPRSLHDLLPSSR